MDSNILRDEQNVWDDGYRRYLAIEKVTLLGSLQIQPQNCALSQAKFTMGKVTIGTCSFIKDFQNLLNKQVPTVKLIVTFFPDLKL